MSLEDQLEEEAHKLVDAALENIPHDYLREKKNLVALTALQQLSQYDFWFYDGK